MSIPIWPLLVPTLKCNSSIIEYSPFWVVRQRGCCLATRSLLSIGLTRNVTINPYYPPPPTSPPRRRRRGISFFSAVHATFFNALSQQTGQTIDEIAQERLEAFKLKVQKQERVERLWTTHGSAARAKCSVWAPVVTHGNIVQRNKVRYLVVRSVARVVTDQDKGRIVSENTELRRRKRRREGTLVGQCHPAHFVAE